VEPRRTDEAAFSLFLIAIAAAFGQFVAVASLAEVASHFGHSVSGTSFRDVVGLSSSVVALGLAILRLSSIAALPLTSLADRFGRIKVLRRVAIVGLVMTALAAGSPSYWSFVAIFAVARPLLSATNTLVQVVTVETSTPNSRATRLAWIAAGAGIGAGTAAVMHGLLPGANAFRLLFALALIPALAIKPLLRRIPEPEAHFHLAEEHMTHLGAVPKAYRGELAVVATLAAVVGVITGPANGFAFVYGEGVLGISRHEVAVVVLISGVSGLLGLLIGRALADRIGRRVTVAIGTVATAVISTIAYSGGKPSFVAGYLVGVFAAALLAPAASALTTEIFPHSMRATAGGWVVVAGVLGATIGILFFGYVGDVVGSSVTVNALRVPAIVTFLPTLPLLLLLRTLPESRGVEID
jgi:MFS family permease